MENKKVALPFLVYSIVVVILLVVLAVAPTLDLSISKAVCDVEVGSRLSSSLVGNIIETVIPSIPFLTVLFCFALLLFASKDIKKKGLRITAYIVCSFFCLALGYYVANNQMGYLVDHQILDESFDHLTKHILPKLGLGLVYAGLLVFLAWKAKFETKSVIYFTILVFFTVGFSNLVINVVVKNIFPRARYRAMMAVDGGDFTYFTAWCKAGIKRIGEVGTTGVVAMKDDFKSFPSGHSNAATTLFLISLMPYFFKSMNKRPIKWATFIVAIVLTLMTLFYRIRVGAHFLSDVTMGSYIGMISCYGGYMLLNIYFKKKEIQLV